MKNHHCRVDYFWATVIVGLTVWVISALSFLFWAGGWLRYLGRTAK